MAILRGEEAKAWIAQNPNRQYRDMTTGQIFNMPQPLPQQPQPSKFMNFVKGVSKPFRHGLGIAGEFGGTIEDLINIAQGDFKDVGKGYSRQIGDLLLDEEERKYRAEDPLQMGIKSGAGVMSYGLGAGPVKGATTGARILSGVGKGALASGVGGFGYSESGKELESTLKGAAIGGAIGGAAQGLREIAPTLKKVGTGGKKKTSFTIKETLGQEPGTISRMDGKARADQFNEVFEELTKGDNSWLSPDGTQMKFKTITPNQRLQANEVLSDLLKDKMKSIAANSPGVTTMDTLQEAFLTNKDLSVMLKALESAPANNAVKNTAREALLKLASVADDSGNVTTAGLNETIQYWDDMVKGFKNMEKGANSIRFLSKMREVGRTQLGLIEPTLNAPKEIYGLLADASVPMERLASTSERGLRVVGAEIPLTGEALRPVFDATTRVANRVRTGIPGAITAPIRGLGAVAGAIPTGIPTSVITNPLSQIDRTRGEAVPGQFSTGYGGDESLYGPSQSGYNLYDALAEAQQLMPGATPSQTMQLAEMLMAQNAPLKVQGKVAAKDYNNAISGLRSLDGLERLLDEGTSLAPHMLGRGDVSELVGGSQYRQYMQYARDVADIIARIRTGAQINEQELKLYMDQYLPKWYDDEATRRSKLDLIRNYFNGIMTGDITPETQEQSNLTSGY
jgi:hypothetical protein